MQKRIFTSESVTEGHPDKVCDQISDGVLDAILAQDPKARVACECCATTGMVMVMGEISTECYVDIPHVARDTICRIGYDKPESGFNGHTCAVLTAIDEQSGDIAMGVDKALEYKEGTLDDQIDTIGPCSFHDGCQQCRNGCLVIQSRRRQQCLFYPHICRFFHTVCIQFKIQNILFFYCQLFRKK